MEKCVYKQLNKFIKEHHIMCDNQNGFRQKHSCETLLLKTTNDWYKAMNTGNITGCVFLDLRKAFDTINHEVLVNKLARYGIHDMEKSWFKHYLFERQQVVRLCDALSDPMEIDVGVPQGSQLGPLLISLYINDLPQVVKHCHINLFADDTELHSSSPNLETIQDNIQKDMNSIQTWLHQNSLVLNVKKTKVILIGTWQRLQKQSINISIGNTKLEQVTQYKYLGITIDSNLSWDKHLNTTITKARYKIMLMRKNKAYLSQDILMLMYKGLIRPSLEYCASMFNNLNKEQCRRLEVVQNDALRVMLHKGRRESATEMRNVLNIPTLKSRRRVKRACMKYKSLNDGTPKYLTDILPSNNSDSRTRSGGWVIPMCNLEVYKSSHEYQGITTWKDLSQTAKGAISYESFKNHARKELLTYKVT